MSTGGVDVDMSEQIKWWDALDAMVDGYRVDEGLRMARECQHPDARWLAALFPASEVVTLRGMRGVMLEQGDDPRALHLLWGLEVRDRRSLLTLLQRAAETGYAPAQERLAGWSGSGSAAVRWAEKAALQGSRHGMALLGNRVYKGTGCLKDRQRGSELMKEAALLGSPMGQYWHGVVAFRRLDWQHFYWRGLAAQGRFQEETVCVAATKLLPAFENGKLGPICILWPLLLKDISMSRIRWRLGASFQEAR
jgi:TPR repeat protein